MTHWLHQLTHRHLSMEKEGTGEFIFCFIRLPYVRKCHVFFRPAFDGAAWHRIEARSIEEVLSKIEGVASANSAEEAMARIRALMGEDHD